MTKLTDEYGFITVESLLESAIDIVDICPSGDCSICGRLETGECLCKEEDDD